MGEHADEDGEGEESEEAGEEEDRVRDAEVVVERGDHGDVGDQEDAGDQGDDLGGRTDAVCGLHGPPVAAGTPTTVAASGPRVVAHAGELGSSTGMSRVILQDEVGFAAAP